jgi:hypothetical protein
MEKKIVNREIFRIVKDSAFTWKDIKHIEFQDDDEIGIEEDEDGSFYACVFRKELETDEEFEARMEYNKRTREMLKKHRYQQYLKLKEEFENKNN